MALIFNVIAAYSFIMINTNAFLIHYYKSDNFCQNNCTTFFIGSMRVILP